MPHHQVYIHLKAEQYGTSFSRWGEDQTNVTPLMNELKEAHFENRGSSFQIPESLLGTFAQSIAALLFSHFISRATTESE